MVFRTKFVLLGNTQCDQKVSVQLFLYSNRQVHRDFLITLYKDVTFSCNDSNNSLKSDSKLTRRNRTGYTSLRIVELSVVIHSFSSLSYDRSKASSKASSPHSAIQSFLLQVRVSSPFLKVIQ